MHSRRDNEVCPQCAGTGWRLDASEAAVIRCECGLAKDIALRLGSARIPPRYQHCTLEEYQPQNDSQLAAKKFAERFADQFPNVDGGLLFVGSAGVGKTHLSVALLKQLIEYKGVRGLFYDFRDLLREIQHSWNPVSQSSELEVLRPVLEAELLVLDELGANKPSAWVQETMTHIINSRYNDKKITIFTSNFPDRDGSASAPKDPLMRREENLTDRVGVRLRSRLYEMCTLV
ncbi:MAG: ATP-binding protein, partial [Acidobacteria bacterium]|nr:ATP-binding protein [Acidobacteriota bacterium]